MMPCTLVVLLLMLCASALSESSSRRVLVKHSDGHETFSFVNDKQKKKSVWDFQFYSEFHKLHLPSVEWAATLA